jgi:general secretion pathway protein G
MSVQTQSSISTARALVRSRQGLTLVEIMVVIGILGMLMTVLAVGVTGYWDDANVQTTEIQIQKLEGALQTYAAKNRGKYPSTSDGLESVSKYYKDNQIPTDSWGNEFRYYSPGRSGSEYEIVSLGKDGAEGGEGSDADISSSTIGTQEEG